MIEKIKKEASKILLADYLVTLFRLVHDKRWVENWLNFMPKEGPLACSAQQIDELQIVLVEIKRQIRQILLKLKELRG